MTDRSTDPQPIACSLSDAEATDRITEWADLLAHIAERQTTAEGMRLRLPPDPQVVAAATELAFREAACCPFFTFTVTLNTTGVWLEVTAPPEGRAVLDALFGNSLPNSGSIAGL